MPNWSVTADRAFWELVFAFLSWGFYVYFATRKTQRARVTRTLLASALLWLFVSARLERVVEVPQPVVVVVDDSASMARTLDDDARTAYEAACAAAKQVVDAANAVGAKTSLRVLSQKDADLSFSALESSKPNADSSPISEAALARLNADAPESSSFRIVLVSDGIENAPSSAFAEEPSRVDSVAVGSTRQAFDLRWENVPSTFAIYGDEQAKIRGNLKLLGSAVPCNVEIRLYDVQDAKLLWTTTTTLSDELAEFEYEWDPPRDRKSVYRVEAIAKNDPLYVASDRPLAKDLLEQRDRFEYSRRNNVAEFTIVPRTKKLNVLLVDDLPRYEYRYAKSILSESDAVELRTLLFSEDPRLSEADEQHFPLSKFDRRNLAEFDVVLIGDVPNELWDGKFSNLTDVVLKEGSKTSLWFLGGKVADDKLMPGAESPDAEPIVAQYALEPTAEGRRLFATLPELFENVEFTQIAPYVKPTADSVVLFNALDRRGQSVPILFTKTLGRNKILWQGVDEIWRLRTLEDKTLYARFMLAAFEFLASENSGQALEPAPTQDESTTLVNDEALVEDSDVAARLSTLQTLSARTSGETLDLLDRSQEDSQRLTEEYLRAIFATPIKVKAQEQIDLAPHKLLLPIVLALFCLAWLPRSLFRRNPALPTPAEIVSPRDTET